MSEGVRARLMSVVSGDDAQHLVGKYFDPTDRRFAGSTFDTLPENPPSEFTAADMLAASLLDVPFQAGAVRSLLTEDSDKFARLLAGIPADIDLWEADDKTLDDASAVWMCLLRLPGVGPTRAGKLLARKRPRLVPVIDKVVRQNILLDEPDAWKAFRAALTDRRLRIAIDRLRPEGLPKQVSTLRVLDAAIWMRYSRSVHVQRRR